MLNAKWMKVVVTGLALCLVTGAFAQDPDSDAVKSQASALFKIFVNRDWKGLFNMTEFSAKTKAGLTDAASFATEFAKGLKEGDPDDDFGKLVGAMTDVAFGRVMVEGKFAYIATSCKIKSGDNNVTMLGICKLIKVNGIWKWDLTFTDDPEQATSQRMQELLGMPAQP